MKKYLLLLALFTGTSVLAEETPSQSTASSLLRNFMEEQSEEKLDEDIGNGLMALFKTSEFRKEIVRLLRLKLSKQELKRLVEICKIVIEIDDISANPQFFEQYSIVLAGIEKMQEPDITAEEVELIDAKVREECLLVVRWEALSEELKNLRSGFGQGMETLRINSILGGIVADLEKTL
jgi:hypothetical protein